MERSIFRQGGLDMGKITRLTVIHRNRLLGESLAWSFSQDGKFQAEYVDYADEGCLKTVEKEEPDIILIGLNLPDSLTAGLTRRFKESVRQAKIALIGSVQEDSWPDLFCCIDLDIYGCFSEEDSLEGLMAAVDNIFQGEKIYSPGIIQVVLGQLAKGDVSSLVRLHSMPSMSSLLTPREREVLQLVALKLANKQIAKRLGLSLYTVKNHVHNIIEKLRSSAQVENRFQAVDYARKRGWLGTIDP